MRLPGPYFPEMATMGGVLVARALQNNQLLVLQCLGGFELRELLRAKRRSARLGCFWRVFPQIGREASSPGPSEEILWYPSVTFAPCGRILE